MICLPVLSRTIFDANYKGVCCGWFYEALELSLVGAVCLRIVRELGESNDSSLRKRGSERPCHSECPLMIKIAGPREDWHFLCLYFLLVFFFLSS